jgi:quinol monooxygenase YgiN
MFCDTWVESRPFGKVGESDLTKNIVETTVGRSMKEASPMEDKKIYLLAELTIRPGFLEEVKAILKEALIPTLQEPGCEALYETGRKDDPHKLVFFEVFSSAAAHEFHLEQDYTKRLFASLEGKMSGVPIMTKLNAL